MPDSVSSDIKVNSKGGSVFCALGTNPRTDTTFDLTRFPLPDGKEVTDPEDAEADPTARIYLGEPTDLRNRMIVQCDARILRNPASDDSTYFAVLRFYQGSSKIGESARVEGDFGKKNSARVKIDCTLK